MQIFLVLILYGFALFIRNVESQCNTCIATSGIACISQDKFQVCQNGVPAGATLVCPTGNTCTATTAICEVSSTPSCIPKCGTCGSDLRFACLNQTNFAFCFGTSAPSTTVGTCPTNTVCNNGLANFCGNPTTTTSDCDATTPPTTTPPTTTPTPLCSGPGRFLLPGDTICKQYVYCFYVNSVLKAQIYTCEGTTVFCSTMQQCIARPASGSPCIC